MTEQPVSWFVIERGWTVAAEDGTEVGSIHEVVGDENADIFDGLAVSTGTPARHLYVPSEQVGEITQGRVALLIGPADIAGLGTYDASSPSGRSSRRPPRSGSALPVGSARRARSAVPPRGQAASRAVHGKLPAVILRKVLWGVLYGGLAAASAAVAKRAATGIWRVATGEEPPLRR